MLRTSGSNLVQYKPARNNAVTVTLTFTTTKSWLGSFTPPSYVPPRLPLSSLRVSSVIQSTYLRVYRPRSFRVFFVCGRNVLLEQKHGGSSLYKSFTGRRFLRIRFTRLPNYLASDNFLHNRLVNITSTRPLTCFPTIFPSLAIVF